MAARFVLDKVVCETISPLSGLARTRSFVHSSQRPAEVLPRYSSGSRSYAATKKALPHKPSFACGTNDYEQW